MTSRTGTPTALTAYLRRATWGLPKARQQELWDELEEHVLTRADHLCALGAPPQEALAQALRELGPPTRVTAGMTRVYLMPKLLLSAGVAALALSAALYALAGGNEGNVITLPVLTQRPPKPTCVRGSVPPAEFITIVSRQGDVTCYTSKDPLSYRGAYLSLAGVRDALETQGAQARLRNERSLEFRLPGGGGGVVNAFFTANGQGYISADQLVAAASSGPASVTLSGYAAPLVELGKVQLRFGNGQTASVGQDFYNNLSNTLLGRLLPGSDLSRLSVSYNLNGGPVHHIQAALPAGEVALLVTRQSRGNDYETATAQVQPDGAVQLRSSPRRLRFVTDPTQLSPYPRDGRIPALLVRITNVPLRNLKTGIFLPSQPTSDAN